MAGFWIVTMAMAVLVVVFIIYVIFQVLAVIGTVFGAAALVQSKKYIKSGAKSGFNLAKGFNIASVVFTVISCITGAVTLLFLIYCWVIAAANAAEDPETEFDILAVISMFLMGCGMQIACIVLKIISGRKFHAAKARYEAEMRSAGEAGRDAVVYTDIS